MFQGKFLTLDRDPQGAAVLRMDPPGQGKPFATEGLWSEFHEALQKLQNAGRIPLLVIQGSKRGFLAGWAPDWMETHLGDEPWTQAHSRMKALFQVLSQLPFPSIAAIHGPCLGEGLELALACDYRIALDQARLQFGFLTEERGLIPEGGMISRLIGLVGWEKATLLVAGGNWIGGPTAKKWGVLDGLARDEAGLRALIVMTMGKALAEGKRTLPRYPFRNWRQRIWESTGMGRSMLARGMSRMITTRVREDANLPVEPLGWLKQLPNDQREVSAAEQLNQKYRKSSATRHLVGFQAEYARWQEANPAKSGATTGAVSLLGSGNAGIHLLALHARKGGQGFLRETNPDLLGRMTLGLKKAMSPAKKLDKLASIEADPEGKRSRQATLTILDGTPTLEGFAASGEVLSLNHSTIQEKASLGVDCGLALLPDRPFLALVSDPRADSRARTWLSSLGCLVRSVPKGCEWLAPMTLWILWDEMVHQISMGANPKLLEESWTHFGFRPGPFKLLDLQGLDLAVRMESAWRSRQPDQVGASWAQALLEAGFSGWPGRRGLGMDLWGRWVPNPLAINLIKKPKEGENRTIDPLWQALPAPGKAREGRDRAMLRLASCLLGFQAQCGWDDITLDRILVAGIGWPAHQPGPMEWAAMRGWNQVRQSLEKLHSLTGRNAYRPIAAIHEKTGPQGPG